MSAIEAVLNAVKHSVPTGAEQANGERAGGEPLRVRTEGLHNNETTVVGLLSMPHLGAGLCGGYGPVGSTAFCDEAWALAARRPGTLALSLL